MNIAFQALLLILFYLPGALFIGALFGGLSKDQELPVISVSLTGRAAAALLCAGGFHGLWFLGISQLSRHGVPIVSTADSYFVLLASSQQGSDYASVVHWESAHPESLFGYFVSICAGATLAGFIIHRIIQRFDLDYKIPWLRFKPQWHYLLSGRYAEDPNSVVWIDALTLIADSSVVYSGLVREYWFDDSTGALDTIWIDAAERQCIHLSDDEPADRSEAASGGRRGTRVVQIPGARFALRMQNVKNVNLVYVSRA